MGIKQGRKSMGGNNSMNGGAVATPKTPDNKRKVSFPPPIRITTTYTYDTIK